MKNIWGKIPLGHIGPGFMFRNTTGRSIVPFGSHLGVPPGQWKLAFSHSHRAMFKLGVKNYFLLCFLVMNMPAVFTDSWCSFLESETGCSRNGNNLYKIWAPSSGPFGHFSFTDHQCNWQILIQIWTFVIGLSCLIRTIRECEKVRQIWTLLIGYYKNHILILKMLNFPSLVGTPKWLQFGLYILLA